MEKQQCGKKAGYVISKCVGYKNPALKGYLKFMLKTIILRNSPRLSY